MCIAELRLQLPDRYSLRLEGNHNQLFQGPLAASQLAGIPYWRGSCRWQPNHAREGAQQLPSVAGGYRDCAWWRGSYS